MFETNVWTWSMFVTFLSITCLSRMTWGKEFAICIPFSAILYTWHAKYSISSSKDIATKVSLATSSLTISLNETNVRSYSLEISKGINSCDSLASLAKVSTSSIIKFTWQYQWQQQQQIFSSLPKQRERFQEENEVESQRDCKLCPLISSLTL